MLMQSNIMLFKIIKHFSMIWENAFLVCETHIYILGETERHSLNYAGGKKKEEEEKKIGRRHPKCYLLQSGIIDIFIFPLFLIVNQT